MALPIMNGIIDVTKSTNGNDNTLHLPHMAAINGTSFLSLRTRVQAFLDVFCRISISTRMTLHAMSLPCRSSRTFRK